MTYVILSEYSRNDLANKVNEYMSRGFVEVGGVCQSDALISQAMKKQPTYDMSGILLEQRLREE